MTDLLRGLGLPGLLSCSVLLFLLTISLPVPASLVVLGGALVGVAATTLLRFSPWPAAREMAITPTLIAFATVAVLVPPTPLLALGAGLGGVATLVWIVDDPDRPPGALARGATTVAIPALAVGIAWMGEVALPSGTFAFGIAAILLAVVLAIIAFVVGRPDLFGREEAATSYGSPP